MLRTKRTFISFMIATALAVMCLYLSREKPELFVGILMAWNSAMLIYVGGNKVQEFIEKRDNPK